MTHDELLAIIDTPRFLASPLADSLRNGLRAVVELHKPKQYSWHEKPACSNCYTGGMLATSENFYPCPTIQAIEKELK